MSKDRRQRRLLVRDRAASILHEIAIALDLRPELSRREDVVGRDVLKLGDDFEAALAIVELVVQEDPAAVAIGLAKDLLRDVSIRRSMNDAPA